MKKLSSASQRASNYNSSGEWYCGFAYTNIKNLGYEEGVNRRDPSSVIMVDNIYYVYYTKSVGTYFGKPMDEKSNPNTLIFPWDNADIFYATSTNGINWQEQGIAVSRGQKGSIDDRTVCTPDVLEHNGKYYIVYQAQSTSSTYTGSSECVGLAISDSPYGPFEKLPDYIFINQGESKLFDENDPDNYNYGSFRNATHDPSLYYYQGKFWLYYKCCGQGPNGQSAGFHHKSGGPDTRWGVAVADNPQGPYKPHPLNPVTNSGHETMLWNYKDGICALLNRDGPEQDTIQFAKDGANFEIMAKVTNTPQAGGAFRSDTPDVHPLEGIRWGLCHVDERGSNWNYIMRFDLDQRLSYKTSYIYPAVNNPRF